MTYRKMSLTPHSSARASFSTVESFGSNRPDSTRANAGRIIPAASAISACDRSPILFRIFFGSSGTKPPRKNREAPVCPRDTGASKDSLARNSNLDQRVDPSCPGFFSGIELVKPVWRSLLNGVGRFDFRPQFVTRTHLILLTVFPTRNTRIN